MSKKSRFRRLKRPPTGPRAPSCCTRHIAQHVALLQLLHGPRPGERCLLCSGPPVWRGIFTPFNSPLYGGNTGQQRLLSYALCAVHMKHPDLDMIEARLLTRCRQTAAPWN